MPVPTPVPRFTVTRSCTPRPAPNQSSATVVALSGLSTLIGTGSKSLSIDWTGTSAQCQLGANTDTPADGSTWPGMLTPTPSTSPGFATMASRMQPAISPST